MLGHADLDIEERAAAPVTLAALLDLLEFYADGDESRSMSSPPVALGHDMRAKFGDAAFEPWRDMMRAYEPPLLVESLIGPADPRKPCTLEEYDAALVEQWARYDRPRHWTDTLIVDAMSAAQGAGWVVCGDESTIHGTEAILNDLATRSGAKRAARDAEAARLEAIHRADLDAEVETAFAIYEVWLAAGEPDDDPDHKPDGEPLAEDHRRRKRAIQRFQIEAEHDVLMKWVTSTELDGDAFEAEYAARLAAWKADHGGVEAIRQSYLQDGRIPPSTAQITTPIPAVILDMHKRQSDQYAAAMIGPLPNHPELPMHQAEALSRFWAHLPSGKMIYEGTRELWSAASLDKHVGRVKDAMAPNGPGTQASTFLSQHRGVQSLGWDPAEPMIIEDRVLTQEGWIHSRGDRTFNRYVPPEIAHIEGDVSLWLDHIRSMYPAEVDHIIKWFAHRVQGPGDKVNHALVFLGNAGIGKDTAIEPVAAAIGRHNFKSITAQSFFKSDFNDYLKSVMLRIDEVHDLGGESKYAFHDRTKPVIAAPPTMHHINEKFVPHYAAKNVCGVILTSNHRDALYLSPDDRRHYVCVSDKRKEDFSPDYFNTIYSWLDNGGNEAVAHYLANLDLSDFNAKAPPPRTEGWHMLVGAGQAPEAGDLADVIETLGKPAALTLQMVRARTPGDSHLRSMFEDLKMRKAIPKRLAECGYVVVANPDARDSGGRWRMGVMGKLAIYGRQDSSEQERLTAARLLSAGQVVPPPPY